jgi:hypothetical protein
VLVDPGDAAFRVIRPEHQEDRRPDGVLAVWSCILRPRMWMLILERFFRWPAHDTPGPRLPPST